MIRNRSRVISSKQALMADYSSSIPSPIDKLFTGFTTFKNFSETTESLMSPTSTLDSKPFSVFKTRTWDNLESKGIGLAIVEALNHGDHKTDSSLSKSESRVVLFGSNLKIQVSPLPVSPTGKSPKSPGDFGIKTRNSQVGSFSSGYFHSPVKKSECDSAKSGMGMDTPNSSRVFNGYLSASEMELSEDYTCVISYGPNPKTTHIFEDCIVESCCGVVEFSPSKTEETNDGFLSDGSNSPPENFLSFCYACKKNLSQGNDIYMYRGEKAFCSSECRYREMLFEAGIEKLDYEDDDL